MDAGSLTRYLWELAAGAMLLLWSAIHRNLSRRIETVEKGLEANRQEIQSVDSAVKKHVDNKFDKLVELVEDRRLETKADLIGLQKRIDEGNTEIIREIQNGRIRTDGRKG